MLIKEFRIPMPMTVDEYKLAQIYTTLECSKMETGGGDGVEEITNEFFVDREVGRFGIQSGQYTLKKLHMDHKVPTFVRILTPRGSLNLQEECWNAYPYCKTVLTNDHLNERLSITIESVHLADRGNTENALNLSQEKLAHRQVVFIDIAKNLGANEERAICEGSVDGYVSEKSGRGPIEAGWYQSHEPIMTCYKLVTIEVKIFGLQGRLENYIYNNQKRIFIGFHRRMFLYTDQWYGLSLEEIREMEIETAQDLEKQRKQGKPRGSRVDE